MSDVQTRSIFDNLPDGVTRLDVVEAIILVNGGTVEMSSSKPTTHPVVHRFTPGMYIREIYMPAGTVLTSKIHKTEHPFVISQGVVSVYSDNDGPQILSAPYTGITKPGTKRLLYVHEDTIWTTFHITSLTDVDEIEDEIIDKRTNPMLCDGGIEKLIETGETT